MWCHVLGTTICPFGRHHVGGQKCIAVIERKVLNVSLFTNASDYSNRTCMERSMCLYLTSIVVSLEYSLVLVSNDTIFAFLSITTIHFWPPTWRWSNGLIRKYPNVMSPCSGSSYCCYAVLVLAFRQGMCLILDHAVKADWPGSPCTFDVLDLDLV